MRALYCATAAFALGGLALARLAEAEPRYDRKLEEAVKAIVAARIGDIRDGFALDEKPVLVVVQDDAVMATTDMDTARLAPPEGMARATDRRPAPMAF